MLYEARTYYAIGGKIGALNERMAKRIVPIFKRCEIDAMGYWLEAVGEGNKLFYMLRFQDFADREARWTAFQNHPELAQIRGEPVLMDYSENRFLHLTSYSTTPDAQDPVIELRIYDAMPGKLPNLHERFANHAMRLFERHGIRSVGYWTETVGTGNRLFYIVGYPDFAARQHAWDAFQGDAEWQDVRARSEAEGPLIRSIRSALLTRLPMGEGDRP